MIRQLTLNNIATFTQAVEIKPTAINYFYGSNGSGKTTLSKVIADESAFPACTVIWENQPIETLVYNRDFVKNHFSQSSTIKGIFTLGKDATEAKAFIEVTTKEIEAYRTKLSGLERGKKSIEDHRTQRTTAKQSLEGKIKEKEADITNVTYTKNEINKILKTFGFTNFSISEAENGYYKIIRQNGVDAKKTLSEGEYTFITFLYFYQLLKGSIYETGLTTDKVIVINVLFIVSNLIKEVTFKGSRQGQWKEEPFWIVRNLNNQSKIIKHDENPIQTTYELLWREIKLPIEQINKVTVFNTMRRILEYYFNIIGGLDYEKSINEFDGEEKIIFKSLFSWINDGSHFINDDLVIYAEPKNIEKQLAVFKGVFKKLKHECHYNMGIENE